MKPLLILKKTIRVILFSFGAIAIFLIILAFTSAPFWIWYKYSTKHAIISRIPDYIIVLGGGGMPSESGLIRCWYAVNAAERFPNSKIIIALPGDTTDSLSSIQLMKKELILHKVNSDRIGFENQGVNTRAQAINIFKPLKPSLLPSSPPSLLPSLLIVTSPEHLTRAVLSFKKAGFLKVDGVPAFEEAIEGDITFNGKALGGRKWIPDVGANISIRYEFWTQLRYEQLIFREYAAIAYYWMMGWI